MEEVPEKEKAAAHKVIIYFERHRVKIKLFMEDQNEVSR